MTSSAARSHPSNGADLEAIARRVFARDRGEPVDGPYSLRPDRFDTDRDLCLDAQERLVHLLRARSAFHRNEAADEPGDGYGAHLSAALDHLADEVAMMDFPGHLTIMLAEAERSTGPLVASAGASAVLDACAADPTSIEGLVAMLVSANHEPEA